ncbi:hypothetical protein KBB06_02955 [Candidatus Gracilibacteria bacterium]|nr:hypothetical protein [Candidatus Gracilibacteria bacterium]
MPARLEKFAQIILIIILGLLIFSSIAQAAECTATDKSGCATSSFSVGTYLTVPGQGGTDFETRVKGGIGYTIVTLINQLTIVIGSFAMLALIIGGFTYLTSSGQERLITKAKDMVKYAVMGLVVALLAYYITAYVQSLFYEIK